MQIEKFSFEVLKKDISKFDYHYATEPEIFQQFLQFLPDIGNFENAIQYRNEFPLFRKELVDCLIDQYHKAQVIPRNKVRENIDLLNLNNTYTITTAHQPTLFGGPFYLVLKIASTIALSKKLTRQFSGKYNFVPVYVIGGEDHDFDEVSWVQLFNKKIQWMHPEKGGPVGRLDHKGVEHALKELNEILGESQTASELFSIFQESYSKTHTFAQATLHWVNTIFERYGLVIANFDHPISKNLFSSLMKEEVINKSSQILVQKTQDKLGKMGFAPQAHARPINLYHITNYSRKRLIPIDAQTIEFEKDKSLPLNEVINDLAKLPQNYSPNVILRPLLQETLLPNLAYIGGGGELAYWIERKNQFNHFKAPFPILIRRDSVSWIEPNMLTKINKLGLDPLHFFQNTEDIVKTLLYKKSKIDFDSRDEIQNIETLIERICKKADSIDLTVANSMRAEGTRIMKAVQQLSSKVLRAEKSKSDQSIAQIENIKSKMFPDGKLQERYEGFIPLYLKTEGEIIDFLVENLDPLSPEWKLIYL